MRFNNKPSFEIRKANRQHTCIYCGQIIPKGTQYYFKQEKSNYIAETLSKETGYSIYEIKARTHFWYFNFISLKFCSLECLQKSVNPTPEMLARKRAMEDEIIQKIRDAIYLVTALGGSKRQTL